jgi:hypothetical protein
MENQFLNQIKELSVEKYFDLLFEQYKLYVQSIERVSERRANANSYFLTLTTGIGGSIGYIVAYDYKFKELFILIITISGILICIYWLFILDNYRKLNSGKFKALIELEKKLPVNLFNFEWEILGKGKNPKLYRKTSIVEKSIPKILIFVYSGLLVIAFIELVKNTA